MGMAASQARLLSLTSRLHDVELKAQNLMSQKIALATQKDELYQDYCDALDATTIKVAFMDDAANTTYVDANYASLCNYNENRVKQYALRDNKTGNIIVSQDVKNNYDTYGNDKYAFAYAMLGYDASFGWTAPEQGCEIGIGTAQEDYGYYSESGTGYSLYMTEAEEIVYNEKSKEDTDLANYYQAVLDAESDGDRREALKAFREYFYGEYSAEIFEEMNKDKQESPEYSEAMDDTTWDNVKPEFKYYINLWEAIKEAGGCQVIEPQYESGENGTEWFNNMVEAGLITIQVFDDTGKKNEWSDTSVATSTNNNYLQEQQDETDLKKAEAEYNHALDLINRKDTKFDTELSKLETERTAITTEMDSIKKVRDDNTDRTFGIFS